jgi:DNA-binding FadR family transcriptional regulator
VHGRLAREIGRAIVAGELRPGHVMDGEIEASAKRKVSRTAYREALRSLSAKGLLQSRPRTGTRVSRVSEWHLLDPDVLGWLFSGTPRPETIHGLYELRTVVEPAAAALAAARRTQDHLADMRRALDDMARFTLNAPEGREADGAFHAALLAASGNPFIVSLTNGVTAAVSALTEYKRNRAGIVRDPVPDHLRVFDAIAAKDADGARVAMMKLIRMAVLDMPAGERPEHLCVDEGLCRD